MIQENLKLLEKGNFFESEEQIEELAIFDYDKEQLETFKIKVKPKLIMICEKYVAEK